MYGEADNDSLNGDAGDDTFSEVPATIRSMVAQVRIILLAAMVMTSSVETVTEMFCRAAPVKIPSTSHSALDDDLDVITDFE